MIIEVCDLCKKEVKDDNKTEVIIKDYKGVWVDGMGYRQPAKRKYKAVICDDCLNKLRGKSEPNPPTGGSAVTKEQI